MLFGINSGSKKYRITNLSFVKKNLPFFCKVGSNNVLNTLSRKYLSHLKVNITKNISLNNKSNRMYANNLSFLKNKNFPFSENNSSANKAETVKFTFVYVNGKKEVPVEAEIGKHILEVAHQFDVDLEGACEASLACSTCHVYIEQDLYDKLPAPKTDEEDLLDLAFGLSHTSRLGCQVKITKEFEGTKISIPSATRNLHVDSNKPKAN